MQNNLVGHRISSERMGFYVFTRNFCFNVRYYCVGFIYYDCFENVRCIRTVHLAVTLVCVVVNFLDSYDDCVEHNRYHFSNRCMMLYVTNAGYKLETNTVPNFEIFQYMSKQKIITPKPPRYTLDDGREIDNEFHPLYADALVVMDLARHNAVLNGLITLCMKLVDKSEIEAYRVPYEAQKSLSDEKLSLEAWFIKYIALDSYDDLNYLTQHLILTETSVSAIFSSIRVTRGGQDVANVSLKNAINTGVSTDTIVIAGHQIVNPLDEINACRFSQMEWQKWLRDEYNIEEKASAIALYRLDKIVDSHNNDAVQIYQEQQARKKTK